MSPLPVFHILISTITFTTFLTLNIFATFVLTEKTHQLDKSHFNSQQLEYGEPCSIVAEQYRLKTSKTLHGYFSSIDLQTMAQDEFMDLVLDILEIQSEIPEALCNLSHGLECSPVTSTCDCMTNSEALIGLQGYFVREDDECRLAPGSACTNNDDDQQFLPPEFVRELSPKQQHTYPCTKNSSCIVKYSGEECNAGSTMREIERLLELEQIGSSEGFGFILNKLKGGLCVCGTAPSAAVLEANK